MCSHSVGLCERVAMYRKRIDIKGSQKCWLQHPYKFRLTTDKYVSYCSVREYSSPAGTCKMPLWVRVNEGFGSR